MTQIRIRHNIGRNLKKKIKEVVSNILDGKNSEISDNPLNKNLILESQGAFNYDKSKFENFSEETILALRKRADLRKKRPDFKTRSFRTYKKLDPNWNRPRGNQNKQRRKLKGKGEMPDIGYCGPKIVSGFSRRGYPLIYLKGLKDLGELFDGQDRSRTHHIIISSKVGLRKRIQMENQLVERKYFVQNKSKIWDIIV